MSKVHKNIKNSARRNLIKSDKKKIRRFFQFKNTNHMFPRLLKLTSSEISNFLTTLIKVFKETHETTWEK